MKYLPGDFIYPLTRLARGLWLKDWATSFPGSSRFPLWRRRHIAKPDEDEVEDEFSTLLARFLLARTEANKQDKWSL